ASPPPGGGGTASVGSWPWPMLSLTSQTPPTITTQRLASIARRKKSDLIHDADMVTLRRGTRKTPRLHWGSALRHNSVGKLVKRQIISSTKQPQLSARRLRSFGGPLDSHFARHDASSPGRQGDAVTTVLKATYDTDVWACPTHGLAGFDSEPR